MSQAEERIALPLPTNATVKGPLLELEGSSLMVKYDHQHDDGRLEWTCVRFTGVLAFEYRQEAACGAEQIVGSGQVVQLSESQWLETRVNIWSKLVGSQKWQQLQGGAKRFRHFRMYFDDAACVDVAAEAISVDQVVSHNA